MKKTGAWLVRYALEQLGISHTFGIPGVHNTEIYDELNKSATIQPMLVTHEGCGAFMADAVSRTSDTVGTMLIVPAAGATHAASGIGEAFLDGIPMLVLSGGVRSDSDFQYQLHDMDQHAMLAPITKATFKVAHQQDIIKTLYKAYDIATSGEPGPVFVEIPVNIQLYTAEVEREISYAEFISDKVNIEASHFEHQLDEAVELLIKASKPGLFLGWGAVDVSDVSTAIAQVLGAPAEDHLTGLEFVSGK